MRTHSESPGMVTVSHGAFAITFRKDPESGKLVRSGFSTLGGRPSKKLAKIMAGVAKQALEHMAESSHKTPHPQHHPKPLYRITETLKQTDAFSTA